MRKILQFLLLKPVKWLSDNFTSKPDRQKVHAALSKLLESLRSEPGKRGLVINIDQSVHKKFIIFSDQHKGAKNGADDFMICENSYLRALDYYFENDFCFVSLGDAEELWENKILS